MKYFIGLDFGTTKLKIALMEEAGAVKDVRAVPCGPEFLSENRAEQDADDWYLLPCAMIKEMLAANCVEGGQVSALSLCSQAVTLICAGKTFQPLRKAFSWLDNRAAQEAQQLKKIVGEEITAITGRRFTAACIPAKLLWIKKNLPELFAQTSHLCTPMEYAIARMTGAFVTDYTMAAATTLFDINRLDWSDILLKQLGITREKLPRAVKSGSVAGRINAETARLSGLSERTVVAVGGQDQKLAAYGADIGPDTATLSLGTAAALETIAPKPAAGVYSCPSVFADSYVFEGSIGTSGASVEWVKRLFFPNESYEKMEDEARASLIGAGGLTLIPRFHSAERNGWIGGISLQSSRGDMMRALYEGIACEITLMLEQMNECGAQIKTIRAFGGSSASGTLIRAIAGISGLPVTVLGWHEMGLSGALRIAARSTGGKIDIIRPAEAPENQIYLPDQTAEHQVVLRRYRDALVNVAQWKQF